MFNTDFEYLIDEYMVYCKSRQLKNERKAKEYITDEDFRKLVGNLDKSYFPEHRDLQISSKVMGLSLFEFLIKY